MRTLFDVAPGDLLILDSRQGPKIVKVKRLTATRIELTTGSKWHKKIGTEVGSCRDIWNIVSIRLPKEGEIDELILTNDIRRKLLGLQTTIESLRRNTPAPSYDVLSTLISAAEALQQLVPTNQA